LLIAGRFRLIERISHGTFAEVWKAADHHGAPPGRLVALKLLLPSARGDPERPWEPVMREVEASARMGPHPNVLRPGPCCRHVISRR
jgi:serine/threonine protein kinase